MRQLVLVLAAMLGVSACTESSSDATPPPAPEAALERLEAIDQAVRAWSAATTVAEAHAAAETATNLIVGDGGYRYGDADLDGVVSGSTDRGLLPADADDAGLVLAAGTPTSCVERDVLGGSWDNPSERWAILDTAIAEWRPDRNTYPALPSHPQRVIGWAALTLATEDLGEATEYAGHAALHVRVSRSALTDC